MKIKALKEDIVIQEDGVIKIGDIDISNANKISIYNDKEELLYEWYKVKDVVSDDVNQYKLPDGSYKIPYKNQSIKIEGTLYMDKCKAITLDLVKFIDTSIINLPLISSLDIAIKDRPLLYFSPIYNLNIISNQTIQVNDIYIEAESLMGIRSMNREDKTLAIWMSKGIPLLTQWLSFNDVGLNNILNNIHNFYDDTYQIKIYY